MSKSSNSEPSTVPASKVCSLTGFSDRWLLKLAHRGYFPPPQRGQYQFVPTIRGLFRYFKERENKEVGPLAAARLKSAQAKARSAEVEAVEAENRVVSLVAAKKFFRRTVHVTSARMLRIAQDVSPLIEGKSMVEREEILKTAIIEALRELSERPWN